MRSTMLLLFVCLAQVTVAQTSPCNPEQQDCTVEQAIAFYRQRLATAQTSTVNGVTSAVAKEVAESNRPTEPPPSFAANIHNTYEDFINLLSFAINKVEESKDGQALIVRFNPFRNGDILAGASLTLAQPRVADVVKNLIPEAEREKGVVNLEKAMGDTDDLTWNVAVSPATDECDLDRPARDRCWGRNPRTYNDLISAILLRLITPATDRTAAIRMDLIGLFPAAEVRLESRRLSEITKATDRMKALDLIRDAVNDEINSIPETQAIFRERHLDLLPKLIDNQPQLTTNFAYHTTGEFGGPDDWAISAEYHFGLYNLNTLRRSCAQRVGRAALGECLQNHLDSLAKTGLSTEKVVITASYKTSTPYRLGSLPLEPNVSFEPLDLPSSSELHIKGQIGRLLQTSVGNKQVRSDIAAEFVRQLRGEFRVQNRLIVTLTADVPVGGAITIPVSVRYANKPEFLGDDVDRIGAHLGISYRLPALFGAQ